MIRGLLVLGIEGLHVCTVILAMFNGYEITLDSKKPTLQIKVVVAWGH